MAKKIDYEQLKIRSEAETTLKESLVYLLKQYNMVSSWQPSKEQKEKLLKLIQDRKYMSYLDQVHSILKSAQ